MFVSKVQMIEILNICTLFVSLLKQIRFYFCMEKPSFNICIDDPCGNWRPLHLVRRREVGHCVTGAGRHLSRRLGS